MTQADSPPPDSWNPADFLLQDVQRLQRGKRMDPSQVQQAWERARRFRAVPLALDYPEDLPVCKDRELLVRAIKDHPVVIVCGDTGSGKTTQLPKMMFEAGCGFRGRIGVTQPRRLAASSMAKRVAEECGSTLGDAVGMQVRFDERVCETTRVKFMTDGILLAELQGDRNLLQYDAILVDEAHERSLNIDFLLGCLKRLRSKRPDLKIVISSATLDADRFSAFFDDAPVIQVQGRMYPVEDRYQPPARPDMELRDQVADALRELDREGGELDTLVFLPGEREILDTQKRLEGLYRDRAEVIPLYARLSLQEQQRAFRQGGKRRIILATNVAETSITLPGIRAVIDSGVVRMHRYHPQGQIQRLQTETVARASAKQRRGRCGRTGPGICVHLYSEEELEQSPAYADPEILRSSLAEVILRMEVQGLPPMGEFPFIDPPKASLVSEGYRTLYEVGAMTKDRKLTNMGRVLSRFSTDPRLARMLVESDREQVLPEILVLVSFLSIQDPRVRPQEARERADQAHARWRDPLSDFVSVLNCWNAVQDLRRETGSRSALRKFCQQNFLHPIRVQEWMNLVKEFHRVAAEQKWNMPKRVESVETEDRDGIHRALLAGMPTRAAERTENKVFRNWRGVELSVFPGSGLFKKPPRWIMSFGLLETQRLFAREVAQMDPIWLEEIAPHLCKQVVDSPRWNPERGFVEATERVVMGNLTVVPSRSIHYGGWNQEHAREIFLEDGLAPADLRLRHPSIKAYRHLLKSLSAWEAKLRRPGYFTDGRVMLEHLRATVPGWVYTAKQFDRWCAQEDPAWVPDPARVVGDDLRAEGYPDWLEVNGMRVRCLYRYLPDDPLKDGVTFVVREQDRGQIPDELLEWTIPAWLPEKVRQLLRGLPKNLRTACQPHARTVDAFLAWADESGFRYTHSLKGSLAAFLRVRLDTILAAPDFDESRMESWLLPRLRVIDQRKKTIYEGGPGEEIPAERPRAKRSAKTPWTRTADGVWPGDALPLAVDWQGKQVYPGLTKDGSDVFATPEEASWSHRKGLVRLFAVQHPQVMAHLEKRLPLPTAVQFELASFQSEGQNALETLLASIVVRSLGNPRSAEEFAEAAERTRGEIFDVAEKQLDALQAIFDGRTKVLLRRNEDAWMPEALRDDMDAQWARLFIDGWMWRENSWDRLPVILEGIHSRLERMQRDVFKDQKKLNTLAEAEAHLLEECRQWAVPLRHRLMEQLEEWRIATFAPELRPNGKVGEARIRAWMVERGL